jgi:hypothetical protein
MNAFSQLCEARFGGRSLQALWASLCVIAVTFQSFDLSRSSSETRCPSAIICARVTLASEWQGRAACPPLRTDVGPSSAGAPP